MNEYVLKYTRDALGDMLAIGEYIAKDNPERAISFVREIREHCEALSRRPLSRPVVRQIGADARRSVFGSYNIHFFVEQETVVIFGVIERHRLQVDALEERR